MLLINLDNIETILQNKLLRHKLPELMPYVDIWEFAVRNPSLKGLRLQAALDFLNAIQQPQIETIETFFGCPVTIDKLEYHTVKNFQCSVEDVEKELNRTCQSTNVVHYRKGDQLYICSWK